MTKIFTFILLIGLSFSIYAQRIGKYGEIHSAPEVKFDNPQRNAEASGRDILNHNVVKSNSAFNSHIIGYSGNPFSGVGMRPAIQYTPELDLVSFAYRQDPAFYGGVGNVGWVRYSLSPDGGSTWSEGLGPLWNSSVGDDARYPQGHILNPSGNTNIDNAHMVFMGPTLEGSNGATWGGLAYGSQLLSDTGVSSNQGLFSSVGTGARLQYIPDGGTVANDAVWIVDFIPDWTSGTGVYTDSLALYQGTIQAGAVSFTEERFYFPVSQNGSFPTSEGISFSPNGQDGYIVALGRIDSIANPEEVYNLLFMTTTDGGQTWSAPMEHSFANDTSVLADLFGDPLSDVISTGFEMDVVVDKNGNPHCFMNLCLGSPPFSVFGASGGVYHVWSNDKGITWETELVNYVQDFRGYWGDAANNIAEDNRPMISRDSSGNFIIMAYSDIDSLLIYTSCAGGAGANAPCGNIDRILNIAGYNVDLDFHSEVKNLLAAPGALTHSFEVTSEIAIDNGVGIELPFTYQVMANRSDYVSPTIHYYTEDITLTYLELGDSSSVALDASSKLNKSLYIYPNPTSGDANIEFVSQVDENVDVVLLDLLGREVLSKKLTEVAEGTNNFNINMSDLENGVYILKLGIGDTTVSRKLIKN